MTTNALVLIIDDDANFREIFSVMLKVNGLRTESAEDAIVGIEKIKQIKPDLVLMDILMPKMNGFEAFMEIRKDPTIKDTRVLFLTSLGDFNAEARIADENFSEEIGAVGYLRKTDDHQMLVQKIEAVIGGK